MCFGFSLINNIASIKFKAFNATVVYQSHYTGMIVITFKYRYYRIKVGMYTYIVVLRYIILILYDITVRTSIIVIYYHHKHVLF